MPKQFFSGGAELQPRESFCIIRLLHFHFLSKFAKKKKFKMAPSGIGIQTHTHVQTYRHQPELCQGR